MEVVVVGGGIVGVSAALTLAEGGARVRVLERGQVAGEASGLNAGVIGGRGWGHQPDLEVALRMGSRERYVDLADHRGHDIGLDRTGTLTLVRTEEEWAWAVGLVDADRRAGRRTELVTSEELVELEPAVDPALLGAVLDPLGARAEPVAATRAFAAEAARAGAVVATGRTVRSLEPVPGGGWEVAVEATSGDGSRETVGADAVVLAAGPWCAGLGAPLGIDIPIVAVRGQMWATAPQPTGLIRHAIAAAESLAAWSVEDGAAGPAGRPPELTHRDGRRTTRHLYGRQRPNGEVVFGGDRVLAPDPVADRAVDGDGIAVNHDHVGQLLPPVAGLAPVRTWAGLMPFSADGRPLLGPVDGCDGLFLAGGLASSGFGRGPMAGHLVARSVLGLDPGFDLSPARPGRRVR